MNLKLNTKHTAILVGAILTSGALAAWAANSGVRLTMNGKTASSDVRTIGGKTYVPIADVAKSLGMVVVKRGSAWEIKKAGGTYQVQDLSGKIGDVLFDGRWRFQVLKVEALDSYTMKTGAELYDYTGLTTFDRPNLLVRPKSGNKLIVMRCRVTNAVKEKRTLWTAVSDTRIHTALTDANGMSYSPVGYDFEGGPIQSGWLLPGAILNFPVLFSVPQNTPIKDLVFSLKNNQNSDPITDVRVSLAQ